MRLNLKKVDKLYDKYSRGGFGSGISKIIQEAAKEIGIEYDPPVNKKRSSRDLSEYNDAKRRRRLGKDASAHAFANIESRRFRERIPRNKLNEFPPNINFINSKIEFEKQYKKLNDSNIELLEKIFRVKQFIKKEQEDMTEEYARATEEVNKYLGLMNSEILELTESVKSSNEGYEIRDTSLFLELESFKKKKDKGLKLQNRTNKEFTEYFRILEELMKKWDSKFSRIMSLIIDDFHNL